MFEQRRRGAKRRRGAALVEAALVLPLVLLFFMGIVEYGRWLMTLHLFNNAACYGAAYASKHTSPIVISGVTYGNAVSDVQNAVTSVLAGQQLVGQAINVFQSDSAGNNLGAFTNAQPGQYVCVQITGTYYFTITSMLQLPVSYAETFQCVRLSEGN
ncbi:MAG: TadE/TadG family type IV pilus assembly protein [Thermoguttaceae bacterium]|jgi:Flp pilus assembly protein TadG